MKARRSVRSYIPDSLGADGRRALEQAAADSASPFGGVVDIRMKSFVTGIDYKPETYGMIRGATDYFLIGAADDRRSLLSMGYRFEQVVLKATGLSLGTCWVGGTFRSGSFSHGLSWPGGVSLKAVCPVGVPATPRVIERVACAVMGSRRRKPFGDLFLSIGDSQQPPHSGRFGMALDMMRLAPSSVNSQPWRALVDENEVHFYACGRSRYLYIDCGIGLCHFHMALRADGRNGRFAILDNPPQAPDGWVYLTTFSE